MTYNQSPNWYEDKYASPSPTPSPRGASAKYYYYAQTPQRPATRAHFRHPSSGAFDYGNPRTASFSPRYTSDGQYATANAGYYADGYASPRYEAGGTEKSRRASQSRSRRHSTSVPQPRPQTARPASSHNNKKSAAAAPRATEADAKRHSIPAGYSLKNWDPTEEPIMLLGSVFDSNSLGKWIYDWTVYKHGPAQPMSEVAGDLWLLLIKLAGKVKRSEECVPRIRSRENKEMIEDFIVSGERLMDKLRRLLKACEAPMLKSAKKREGGQLGLNAGVEFVNTLFGRERELEKTERFMTSVRLWNHRFDANCEDILRRPTV